MSTSENTAPAIEIKGLTKTYKKTRKAPAKEALKGVDLTIERGSIFGLLGPNGAGKSTMINILAGLVTKSSGSAKICGFDIENQMRQARGSIGVVPQEITMDVYFTPYQALELQAGYYGVPKSERRSDEILAALGLADNYAASFGNMSRNYMRAVRQLYSRRIILKKPKRYVTALRLYMTAKLSPMRIRQICWPALINAAL